MRIEHGRVEGNHVLEHDLKLHGMWVGACQVTSGSQLELHGMVTGDLVVDDGASATVNGTVSGNLITNGQVTVFGRARGQASGPGLRLRSGASVSGRTAH